MTADEQYALLRVERAAREARRRQKAWYAMRSDRNLYAAKDAERDLDKELRKLDDLRAAERDARVQPRLTI